MPTEQEKSATEGVSGIEQQATPTDPKDALSTWLGYLRLIRGLGHWGRGLLSRLTEPGRDLTHAKAEAIRVDSLAKLVEARARAVEITARGAILNQNARSKEIKNERDELALGLLKDATKSGALADIKKSVRLIEMYGAAVDVEIPPEALEEPVERPAIELSGKAEGKGTMKADLTIAPAESDVDNPLHDRPPL